MADQQQAGVMWTGEGWLLVVTSTAGLSTSPPIPDVRLRAVCSGAQLSLAQMRSALSSEVRGWFDALPAEEQEQLCQLLTTIPL